MATVLFGAWLFVRWLCCWKNIRRSLFGVACFVTLIALFYAEEDWRGKHDWERFKRQWEAKGEHFSFASVVPPPVPADENFALTPIVASSYEALFDKNGNEVKPRNTNVVDRLWMLSWRDNPWTKKPNDSVWPEAKFVDLEAWQDFFRSTPPTNSPRADATNTFPMAPKAQSPSDDVLLALSKYNSAIAKLRQASRLPYSRFPLTYDKEPPGEILLPHLAPLKSCVQTLMLRAIAELQNGQSDQAFADVKLMLYLINSIRSEPFLISHLVRIAMLQITLQPIYDGLAEHKWSDAQLNELDSELAKLNFMADFKLAMRGEMILCQIGFFDYLRHHPKELPVMINASAGTPPILARTLLDLIPKGWFYQNQLRCARAMEGILQVANAKEEIFFPSMARKMDTTMKTERRHLNASNLIEPLLLPTLAPAAERFAYAQESADLARMAIALERYHLAHGEYPASLDVLAPQFIKKLPHDIIGGRALHYRRTADGQFVLYSVGWNETDDGGTVAFTEGKSPRVDISEGDWVWRYPAK
ncbi:MAG: hypothetical protein KGJ60_12260 [Verrucomicrobiota bacterium]|nr:hypothetical protein [Verrucomicrobiota bacterium]